MRIGIVGLGLMGASIAKALKKNTTHFIAGADIDHRVASQALREGVINEVDGIKRCDVVYCCINPRAAVEYIRDASFYQGAVVTDICGVKRFLSKSVSRLLKENKVRYVGSHPMAGREEGGYANSSAELFTGASYIICRDEYSDEEAVSLLAGLARDMGFAHISYSTPQEHDRVIAYTSQLAHVVSNAYVKNPLAQKKGFSAGSFEDLTRVARLDPKMWAELFIENEDNLCEDIDIIIEKLMEIRGAAANKDWLKLHNLLKEGSDIKQGL